MSDSDRNATHLAFGVKGDPDGCTLTLANDRGKALHVTPDDDGPGVHIEIESIPDEPGLWLPPNMVGRLCTELIQFLILHDPAYIARMREGLRANDTDESEGETDA